MSYYTGLSILSNVDRRQKKAFSAESRRILSVFENRKIEERNILKEEGGRPFFPDRDVDFNISHSGEAVAVSYVSGKGFRVGCDIEQARPRSSIAAIARDKFSKDENNYLFTDGAFNNINFYVLWTLKECYIKLRGLSVFDLKNVPSFIKDNELSFNTDSSKPLTFRTYQLCGGNKVLYILSEAIEGEYLQSQIHWLSALSLECKMTAEIKAAAKKTFNF